MLVWWMDVPLFFSFLLHRYLVNGYMALSFSPLINGIFLHALKMTSFSFFKKLPTEIAALLCYNPISILCLKSTERKFSGQPTYISFSTSV